MTRLLKGGTVVNVFTGMLEKTNILIENEKIIGVGDYNAADIIEDVSGKIICPGFIDGHIHIESTMMTPVELSKVVLPHGTTSIIADPHEIANVCGADGIQYMLEASENIPLNVYFMLPSCVPSSRFDETGASLTNEELKELYRNDRVLGLGEMMDYPGVIACEEEPLKKIRYAREIGKHIDGHAPLLTGADLDKYISEGISTDHECSSFEEAAERIRKGQWVMTRQGSAARNLEGLIDLFEKPWAERCLLATDDKHPADLISDGHIDAIIRKAIAMGKNPVTAIQMATIRAANCFGIKYVGAIAPGYRADIVVLSDLTSVDVCDVYSRGEKIVNNKSIGEISSPVVNKRLLDKVYNSFDLDRVCEKDFYIQDTGKKCRVIKTIQNQLLTREEITRLDFSKNNGIDIKKDILKIAVVERHRHTGHIGLGYISGIGLKKGAIACSISHDSHNIIVVGTNDKDMAFAVNRIISMRGGCVAVENEKALAEVALPIAGLISEKVAFEIAAENAALEKAIMSLGCAKADAPLMTMAFMSLPVIPDIKMTTKGIIDVNKQTIVPLFTWD